VLDLNVVVGDIEKMLRRLIGEDIDLRSVLGPAVASVKADRGQIEQVLVNLAVNARDAMPEGGRLTIEISNVDLDQAYARAHGSVIPGSYVLLAVTDTGHGMDASIQSRIFEPFFTTKREGHGTGLGLATVYGIVKQSGGYIWVYTEPGRGTTFKIYLPRVFDVETVAPREDVRDVPRGTERVLLVEDDEALRRMSGSALRMFGFRVEETPSAEEALKLVDRGLSLDVLLTDMVLPRMTGPDLAATLKNRIPNLKVVFMSGYAEQALVHQQRMGAGQVFLAKPFTPEVLARKLRDVLDGVPPA
jgi:CheY-like chemotaxis protein